MKVAGADCPRLDAEVLLAEALGCRRIELYTSFEDVPDDEHRAAFRDLVRRRAEGCPVAYLVGRREFYSLEFKVGPGVLIPRPETELLVVALLDLAKGRPAEPPPMIADVGTGSGILAVCAAKHLPAARVTAIDISPAAIEIAAANAAEHGVAGRIEFLQGDLLAGLDPPAGSSTSSSAIRPTSARRSTRSLPRDVKDYEPRAALLAGPRGTEVIERLVPQAAEQLGARRPSARRDQSHDPQRRTGHPGRRAALEPAPTIKDLARLPRVVRARRK